MDIISKELTDLLGFAEDGQILQHLLTIESREVRSVGVKCARFKLGLTLNCSFLHQRIYLII
jgi:hypothetical protein